MDNYKKFFFALVALTSLSFGQFSQGTKTVDGELAIYAHEGDNITVIELSLGQFLADSWLVEGGISYMDIDNVDSDTSFELSASYFMNDRVYAGLGMLLPEEGEEELFVNLGMLSPFMMSESVYLNPSIEYHTESEVFTLGLGLKFFFE